MGGERVEADGSGCSIPYRSERDDDGRQAARQQRLHLCKDGGHRRGSPARRHGRRDARGSHGSHARQNLVGVDAVVVGVVTVAVAVTATVLITVTAAASAAVACVVAVDDELARAVEFSAARARSRQRQAGRS
jgi:hypothetical protein